MNNPRIFGLNTNEDELFSPYIPFISFATQEYKDKAESYVIREAELFFKIILNIQAPIQFIPYYKTITSQDFNKVEMEYFYNTLFFDLGERDINGKLIAKLKWSISFDEDITPIKVAYLSPSFSGDPRKVRLRYSHHRDDHSSFLYPPNKHVRDYRKYGFISVNGEPVLYYLYFTLQEILDSLK